MKQSFRRLGILTLVGAAFASIPVHAYLDPGTGSMIIQILIGFLAGFALVFKNFWRKLFSKKVIHEEPKKD